MDFKVTVDTLSSVAAIVAIVAAMISWYRGARRPLQVDRVILHRKEGSTTFILMVKNVKSDPVTIGRIGGYKRKKHQVQRKRGGAPEYSATFSSADMIFDAKMDVKILPNGYTDVRIEVTGELGMTKTILFLLQTSHGHHELWCGTIEIVEVGRASAYSLEYQYEFDSAWRAKAVYFWKRLQSVVGK